MNKRIYLSSPTMHGLEMKYIQEAFDTNWVAPLGKEIAAYVGVKYAAALVSGSSATVNPVSYEGNMQVFIDSERETWNMDLVALEKALTGVRQLLAIKLLET